MDTLIGIITNNHPDPAWWYTLLISALLIITVTIIYVLKGRTWAIVYFLLIPFLNWSFSVVDLTFTLFDPGVVNEAGVSLHPMTIVTGLVFVVRDFAQREIGHRILIVMAMAVAWSFYYASPDIALASGIAFAISETVDWLMFTFTKYRLSTRVLLSSALAAPLDSTVFLYGAGLLTPSNWIVFVFGKMIGAVVVSLMVRYREDRGGFKDVSTA